MVNNPFTGSCPPFSPEEILSLRGQPVAKKIEQNRKAAAPVEEWVYLSGNSHRKECYFFINNHLVGWSEES